MNENLKLANSKQFKIEVTYIDKNNLFVEGTSATGKIGTMTIKSGSIGDSSGKVTFENNQVQTTGIGSFAI